MYIIELLSSVAGAELSTASAGIQEGCTQMVTVWLVTLPHALALVTLDYTANVILLDTVSTLYMQKQMRSYTTRIC